MIKTITALCISFVLICTVNKASATLIEFDEAPFGSLSFYEENGFILMPVSGNLFVDSSQRLDTQTGFILSSVDDTAFDFLALQAHDSLWRNSEWTAEGTFSNGATISQMILIQDRDSETFRHFSFNGFENVDSVKFTTTTAGSGISVDNINVIQKVPEPTTLAIFALGMIGLVSRRFKKQS